MAGTWRISKLVCVCVALLGVQRPSGLAPDCKEAGRAGAEPMVATASNRGEPEPARLAAIRGRWRTRWGGPISPTPQESAERAEPAPISPYWAEPAPMANPADSQAVPPDEFQPGKLFYDIFPSPAGNWLAELADSAAGLTANGVGDPGGMRSGGMPYAGPPEAPLLPEYALTSAPELMLARAGTGVPGIALPELQLPAEGHGVLWIPSMPLPGGYLADAAASRMPGAWPSGPQRSPAQNPVSSLAQVPPLGIAPGPPPEMAPRPPQDMGADAENPPSGSLESPPVIPPPVIPPEEVPPPTSIEIPEAATGGLLACGVAVLACGRRRAKPVRPRPSI